MGATTSRTWIWLSEGSMSAAVTVYVCESLLTLLACPKMLLLWSFTSADQLPKMGKCRSPSRPSSATVPRLRPSGEVIADEVTVPPLPRFRSPSLVGGKVMPVPGVVKASTFQPLNVPFSNPPLTANSGEASGRAVFDSLGD
jgi:hypothetical protein